MSDRESFDREHTSIDREHKSIGREHKSIDREHISIDRAQIVDLCSFCCTFDFILIIVCVN